MVPYIVHSSILLTGCFIFYWLFIRRETFFKLNRWVLVASIVLSMLLPLITIPASWSIHSPEKFAELSKKERPLVEAMEKTPIARDAAPPKVYLTDSGYVVAGQEPGTLQIAEETKEEAAIEETAGISFSQGLRYVYLTGVVIFIIAFFVQLFILLAKMIVLESVKDGKFRIVELTKDEAPYSFWNTIFINPTKYEFEIYEQIIAHEKIHIEQAHFIDKIIAELMVIIFWFNPFVWFFRNAITKNLEFLTDSSMLNQGVEKKSYQMSLLKVSVPQLPLNLTTNYNQSFLKNRIIMMNAKKSSAQSSWKYLFILPLFGLSMISMNGVDMGNEKDQKITSTTTTTKSTSTIAKDTIPVSVTSSESGETKTYINGTEEQVNYHLQNQNNYVRSGENTEVVYDENRQGTYVKDGNQDLIYDEARGGTYLKGTADQVQIIGGQDKKETSLIGAAAPMSRKAFAMRNQKHLEDLLSDPMTVLNSSNNKFWNWPACQKDLIKKLQREGLIKNTENINFEIGQQNIFVQGKEIASAKFQEYIDLFSTHGVGVSAQWKFKKRGNHILIIDPVQRAVELRNELWNQMAKDRIIEANDKKVVLELRNDELMLNGKGLANNISERYFNLLSQYDVTLAPGKKITLNDGQASIRIDYEKNGAKTGTWVGYDKDGVFIGTQWK